MPLDAGIFAPYVPKPVSPLDVQHQLMQQDLMQGQIQTQGLALKQAAAVDAQRTGLRAAVQSGQLDLNNPDHQTQALAQFPDVAPAVVSEITKRADMQSQKALRDAQASEHTAKAQADIMDVATRHLAAANPLDDESMVAAFQKATDAGLYGTDKKTATDRAVAEIEAMPPKTDVPARMAWYAKQLQTGLSVKDGLEQQHQAAVAAEAARHNTATEGLTATQQAEAARHDRAGEAVAAGTLGVAQGHLALAKQTAGIPSGYEADPTAPPSAAGGQRVLRPIAGGPADPNGGSASGGGRQAVMFDRVVLSAKEATAALRNISDLPITASTGWLGTDKSTGIFTATKNALAQKMTPQDAQDTKVMFAGVSRALGAIETAGLQVNSGLMKSMDSVTINEGDTQMTKLRKLAEVRQIVEQGLEPSLSNPRIPQVQKDMVKQIIADVQNAVPYTHADITRLQQSKNPQATISDFAKSSGVQQTPPPAAGFDPEKERRYQEWKAKQK